MIAGITSVYDKNTVILAGLGTALVTVALTFYAMITKVNIQVFHGFVSRATASAFALLYPGFVAGFILLLARSGEGFSYIATLVIMVGCNDTFAWAFGVLLGKHPLAPKISPKKTWEGFFGGLIFSAIGSSLAFYYLLDYHPVIGALAGCAGALTAIGAHSRETSSGTSNMAISIPSNASADSATTVNSSPLQTSFLPALLAEAIN